MVYQRKKEVLIPGFESRFFMLSFRFCLTNFLVTVEPSTNLIISSANNDMQIRNRFPMIYFRTKEDSRLVTNNTNNNFDISDNEGLISIN